MSNNKFDFGNVLKDSFNEVAGALNVVSLGSVIKVPWQDMKVEYPNDTQEVYTYYDTVDGNLVATVTLTYTDASKGFLSRVIIAQ